MKHGSTVTLPMYWASALINGDYSGLDDPKEAQRCLNTVADWAANGWSIVSDVENSERFTRSYQLYDPGAECSGGEVCDYILLGDTNG